MTSEQTRPAQQQYRQPGQEEEMHPQPQFMPRFVGAQKLKGKVALITGGDSGIGRAVAVAMAREGADIAIVYLEENEDADTTVQAVEDEGGRAIRIPGDVGNEAFCAQAVRRTVDELGRLDILVNNAAEQHETHDLAQIESAQIERTFRTNIFSFFYMAKHALAHLKQGSTIINTASITAFEGHDTLLDYAATKGAIVAFTRSLAKALLKKGIRVNAVAPGPIWTPLIPASFNAERTSKHGASAPMQRPGQPNEVSPAYIYLASADSSYVTGQVIHVNGGTPE